MAVAYTTRPEPSGPFVEAREQAAGIEHDLQSGDALGAEPVAARGCVPRGGPGAVQHQHDSRALGAREVEARAEQTRDRAQQAGERVVVGAGSRSGSGLEIRRPLDPFVSSAKCVQSTRQLHLMARIEGPPKMGSVPGQDG